MNRKSLFLTLLISAAIFLLAACTPKTTTTPAAETEEPPPSATAEPVASSTAPVTATAQGAEVTTAHTAFPVALSDALGREVVLQTQPQRIVSLAPSNTEILFAVGAGDQVVGVTEFCNYPEEATSREQVGGFMPNTISVEKIVSLEPDLVVSAGEFQQPVIDALQAAGIAVFALDATTFEEVYANILSVGQLTGHEDQALQAIAQMQDRVAAVQDQIADVPDDRRPKVFWEVWDEPLMTAGPTTFTGQMVALAGGINIFADVTEQYPQINAEEIITRNPDVILGPDTHAAALTAEKIRERPGWSAVRAVQDGRIFLIDGDISSRPGPRLADGLEDIAKALYPDRFD